MKEAVPKNPKILFVANVAKEHILKFHIPTIRMLAESGWQVDVACSGDDKVPYCNKQFEMKYKRSPFNIALLKGIKQLKRIVEQGEYDIIYCHTPVGGVAARLASIRARKKGTKVVYMAHGHYFYKGGPKLFWMVYYPIEKILSAVTDSIILINQEDYDITVKKFKNKKNFLINGIGVNTDRFDMSNRDERRKKHRQEMGIPEGATVLIYLAELIPNKNQTLLIRVLKKILKEKKDVYLLLAGIDHTDGEFERYAKKEGVSENIRFLGWREDVGDLYAMSDICVASSIREGFGLNLVEAMSCKIPVVATINRGHKTIINDTENGFLVPLNDEDFFASRIMQLIEDKGLTMSIVQKAFEDCEKYSSQKILLEIKKILEEHI